MKETFVNISNNNVGVGYVLQTNCVAICNTKTGETKVFGGWDDLKVDFDLFIKSFGFNVTYQDALEYFKPNIAQKIIS